VFFIGFGGVFFALPSLHADMGFELTAVELKSSSLFLRFMLASKQGEVHRILWGWGKAFPHLKRDSGVLRVQDLSKVGAA
jgi:hypothetical protein